MSLALTAFPGTDADGERTWHHLLVQRNIAELTPEGQQRKYEHDPWSKHSQPADKGAQDWIHAGSKSHDRSEVGREVEERSGHGLECNNMDNVSCKAC